MAAGSQFGYRLLFVVLLAGIFAVYLQVGYTDSSSIRPSLTSCAVRYLLVVWDALLVLVSTPIFNGLPPMSFFLVLENFTRFPIVL